MRNTSSVFVTFLLATLFGIAAFGAFLALSGQDSSWWLPLAIVSISGIGLILHVMSLSKEADDGPNALPGQETAMASTNRFTTRAQRNVLLPRLTVIFVVAAVIATAVASLPEEVMKFVLASL
jgi:hypothetical protein